MIPINDYQTRPLGRLALRQLSKCVRRVFGLNEIEPFPVLQVLEQLCVFFKGTEYSILEDKDLPADVFAWCYPKTEGGIMIEIKQTVYDEAYLHNNRAFLCFICHEICHAILFHIGFMPTSARSIIKGKETPAYRSVEWQAKALCGELTIPYDATIGMNANEIMELYPVTKASAKYRVKLDKK